MAAIDQAIQLHQAHMDGSAPTTPESQGRLMDLLLAARDEQGGEQEEDMGEMGGGPMMGMRRAAQSRTGMRM